MNDNLKIPQEKKWKFCPNCRQPVPDRENVKFCVKCGLDFSYVKEHKNIPSKYNLYQLPPIQYGMQKLSDDEIYEKSDQKLWGVGPSIGFSLLSLAILTGLSSVLILVYILMLIDLSSIDFTSIDSIINALESLLNKLDTLTTDNYFIIASLLLEISLILIPIIYVGRFLKRPTLRNRLALLGFKTRSYSVRKIFKEIGIGVGCAVSSVFLIYLISFLLDLFIPTGGAYDPAAEMFISLNLPQLIIIVCIMIIIVAPSEEIVFRGFLQKGLVRSKLGIKGGILITALIFSMIHVFLYVYDFTLFFVYFIPYFFISLSLGLVYYWRKEDLLAVMIMHGVYNSLLLIIQFLFL